MAEVSRFYANSRLSLVSTLLSDLQFLDNLNCVLSANLSTYFLLTLHRGFRQDLYIPAPGISNCIANTIQLAVYDGLSCGAIRETPRETVFYVNTSTRKSVHRRINV